MLKRVSFVVLSVALIAAYESAIGQSQELKTPTTAEAIAANQKFMEQTPSVEELPCVISRFDNIMRKVGAEEGQDWRLMSAIAYSESPITLTDSSITDIPFAPPSNATLAHFFNYISWLLVNSKNFFNTSFPGLWT